MNRQAWTRQIIASAVFFVLFLALNRFANNGTSFFGSVVIALVVTIAWSVFMYVWTRRRTAAADAAAQTRADD